MSDCLRTRHAEASGVSLNELRGPRWVSVSHGVHMEAGGELGLVERCRGLARFSLLARVISHWTAAAVHCLWLPQTPDWLPLMATLPPDTDRPERRGLYVARSRAAIPTADRVDGLAVLPAALCIGQLAEDLRLIDLVVAIDSALSQRLCTVTDIEAGIRSRQRGLPMLRRALELCDGRSESAWESILRMLHALSQIEVEP